MAKIFLLVFSFTFSVVFSQQMPASKQIVKLMGCRFEMTATAMSKEIADSAINIGIKEIERIENLISEWDTNSQTSEINRNAGLKPVKVDKELYDLIYRSKKISALTKGAFDISFASMDKIWIFDGKDRQMPDSNSVRIARSKINWNNIILDMDSISVFLKDEGMKIGFGAIGKGYAANKAKSIMENIEGILGGVVNASGDLITWGKSNNPDGWTVQIADPKEKSRPLGWVNINDMSIVTSGDYEKFFTNNGVRYSHIINPLTGYPATETKSVTIISPDAELSDALATSVSVMGVKNGLDMINKLNNVEGIIVNKNDEVFFSDNLEMNYFR